MTANDMPLAENPSAGTVHEPATRFPEARWRRVLRKAIIFVLVAAATWFVLVLVIRGPAYVWDSHWVGLLPGLLSLVALVVPRAMDQVMLTLYGIRLLMLFLVTLLALGTIWAVRLLF